MAAETGPAEPGVEDATRRTLLANERTWLAWWRTGIAVITAGLAVGRLIPSLIGATRWPYAVLGAGYAALGLAVLAFGERRQRRVLAALREGRYDHLDPRAVRAFTVAGAALAALTLVLLLVEA
jgi:putative membrane protein